jgi:protein SCO1/2
MEKTSQKLLFGFICVIALAAGVALALVRTTPVASVSVATVFDEVRPLPAFELVDATARSRTTASLEGRWAWLFFGFTACPDVCPATLGILASAIDKIDSSRRPDVYLISVDPERDTPERLASYVHHFNPAFNALTGPLAEVERLAEGLYASFAKVPLDGGGYTMDHFAGIYMVNDKAQVVAISTTPHDATALASDYLALRTENR